MKLVCDKQQLNSLLDIINKQPDAHITALFNLPDDIIPLLSSEFWPRSIFEGAIVTDEDTKIKRANSIVKTFVNIDKGVKFLDFGCGDSRCAEVAEYDSKISVGYDILNPIGKNTTSEWSEILRNAPYDVIMLYDVIDHIKAKDLIATIELIKTVCDENTVLKIKCHPWFSIHGGHMYYQHNKAFAHLFLKESDTDLYVNRSFTSLADYDSLFNNAGFTIKDRRIHTTDWDLDNCLEFFDHPDMIMHFNSLGIKVSKTCKDSVLNIAFIDYEIKLNGPNRPFVL